MKRTIMMVALGSWGWAVALGSAIAFGDVNAYPGAACTPNIGSLGNSADIQELFLDVRVVNGVLYNQGFNESCQAVCPLVPDNTTNTNGLSGEVLLYPSTFNMNGDALEYRLIVTRPETSAFAFPSPPVQADFGDD
jgi:hypothetical protein